MAATPTKGSRTIDNISEIQGKALRQPRSPSRRMPEAEPMIYTSIAAPPGMSSAVSRSMFKK